MPFFNWAKLEAPGEIWGSVCVQDEPKKPCCIRKQGNLAASLKTLQRVKGGKFWASIRIMSEVDWNISNVFKCMNSKWHLKTWIGFHQRMLFWKLVNTEHTFPVWTIPRSNQTLNDGRLMSLQKYSSWKGKGKVTLAPFCNPWRVTGYSPCIKATNVNTWKIADTQPPENRTQPPHPKPPDKISIFMKRREWATGQSTLQGCGQQKPDYGQPHSKWTSFFNKWQRKTTQDEWEIYRLKVTYKTHQTKYEELKYYTQVNYSV